MIYFHSSKQYVIYYALNRIRCLCDINRNNLEEMINLDIHACMKTSYETQV